MKRIRVRRYSFGYRIVEEVGVYQNKTLTIEWSGLFESIDSAKRHAELILRQKLEVSIETVE